MATSLTEAMDANTFNSMGNLVYEDSEYNAGLPVAVAEVEALLARGGRPISKDERKTVHFLQRVLETIDSLNVDLGHLRRRVDELSMQTSRRGVATSLNPVDALKYASSEEIEQVVGRMTRQRLSTLRHQVSQSLAELDEVRSVSERGVAEVNKAVANGDIEQSVADRILAALEVPEISSSHVLTREFYSEEDLAWERENMPEVADFVQNESKAGKAQPEGNPAAKEEKAKGVEDAAPQTRSAPKKVDEEVSSTTEQEPKGKDVATGSGVKQNEVKINNAPPPVFGSATPVKSESNPFEGGWAQDLIRDSVSKKVSKKEEKTVEPAGPAIPVAANVAEELFDAPAADANIAAELFDNQEPSTDLEDLFGEGK